MFKTFKLFSFPILLVIFSISALAANQLRLIPYPQQVKQEAGTFTVTSATRIVVSPKHAKEDRVAAEMLAEEIESASGIKTKIVVASVAPAGSIELTRRVPKEFNISKYERLNEEGYELSVGARRVTIAAKTTAGVFYGA